MQLAGSLISPEDCEQELGLTELVGDGVGDDAGDGVGADVGATEGAESPNIISCN